MTLRLPLTVLGVVAATSFAVCMANAETFKINGQSMEPTLTKGATVSCDTTKRGAPNPGDIVIYKHPKNPKAMMIKTVVAMGGDSVVMRNQVLRINGRKVPQTRDGSGGIVERLSNGAKIKVRYSNRHAVSNFMPPMRVPKAHVFVLGNNRDVSIDSRVSHGHGPVPIGHIQCVVMTPTVQ